MQTPIASPCDTDWVAVFTAVQPTITTLDLQQLASGDRLALQVYQFRGATSGKKAYIQANLHGAEIAGNAVIYHLIDLLSTLDPDRLHGEIWLVPTCNPPAANQRTHFYSTGRYNPYDGRDWNRIFWDYSAESPDLNAFAKDRLDFDPDSIRQQFLDELHAACDAAHNRLTAARGAPYREHYRYCLQSLCRDANYVLDLHTSSNRSLDYLYCFDSRADTAPLLLYDYGLLMDSYSGTTFDESFLKIWLDLETAFSALGRNLKFDLEAWTLELGGGMTVQPESCARGCNGIKNYLASKGMLDLPDFPLPAAKLPPMTLFHRDQLVSFYAPAGGTVLDRPALGSRVQPGDLLYRQRCFDRDGELPRTVEVRADDAGLVFDLALNEAANQGDYVLSVLTDTPPDSSE